MTWGKKFSCAAAALAALAAPAGAAEYGLGNYLLGYQIPLSGFTPPPGVYFQNTFYLYDGSAGKNVRLPFGNQAALGVREQFVMNITQISWVTDLKALGGSIGFAAVVPFGSDRNTIEASFVGPRGVPRDLDVTRQATAIGDTAYAAFIGWENGDHHWNLTLSGFAPTGQYDADALAFTSLNRPAVDLKAAYTYLSMTTGIEASAGVGMTFNAINSATGYQSGEELHVEAALNQHLPFGLAVGVGGYFYQQVTADNGGELNLGPFKGRVAAVGPLLSWTIKAGEQQVILSGRWFHEFATQNRVRGDSIFASMAFAM
ncbi:transporter [Methylocella sp.]|uniref:SphA family protein n=1 Tax=Methylocella sp. TaxID=1978226 RepID=UPI00378484D6